MPSTTTDVIIIGSGQAGSPLAATLAQQGKQVVVFERGAVGGTCINSGCTPSKAFLASAHRAGRARSGAPLGVYADVRVDFPAVMERVRSMIAEYRTSSEKRLQIENVRLIRAEARFTGERTVTGGDVTVSAPLTIINSGQHAYIPPIEGLAQTPYLDNASFFEQRSLPKKMLILGAGYIGLELGQGMLRCGSEVHLIYRAEHLLDAQMADAAAKLETVLRDENMILHPSTDVTRVRFHNGVFSLECKNGPTIEGDALLVATGRTPNTSALNLEASGIATDKRGYVQTDAFLETSCKGVYALGDVAGQPAFTHVAWEDHRRLLATLDGTPRRRDDLPLVYTTFTDPQIARVGLTVQAAKQAGHPDAVEVHMPLEQVARAYEWGETNGFFSLVVDKCSEEMLGATLVCYEAGELIHVFVAHLMHRASWKTLAASMDDVHLRG